LLDLIFHLFGGKLRCDASHLLLDFLETFNVPEGVFAVSAVWPGFVERVGFFIHVKVLLFVVVLVSLHVENAGA